MTPGRAQPFLVALARGAEPVVHGGEFAAECAALGVDPSGVVDLSVNTNPLGPNPAVLEAIQRASVDRYPSVDASPLRARLGDALGVDPDWIAVGNGSSELIWLTALATIQPGRGDRGVVIGPTYGEYARAIVIAGGAVEEWRALAPQFAPVLPQTVDRQTRVIYCCIPNNPTGQTLTRDAIRDWILGVTSEDGPLVVIDEAYRAFADAPMDLLPLVRATPNVILVRSMTKDHGVPGVRIGYAVGQAAGALRSLAPPWTVGSIGIAAGEAALRNDDWARAGAAIAQAQRERLARFLQDRGVVATPSVVNFMMVDASPYGGGAGLRRLLLRRAVAVRDCASFGLPQYVRIAVGTTEQMDRLFDAWPTTR